MMNLGHSGSISGNNYADTVNSYSLRPVVCLKSDVLLKEVSGGYEIE